MIDAAAALADDLPLARRITQLITNLGIAVWDVWRRGDEVSITMLDLRRQRCVVFDLGSLAGPDERTVVALSLLGHRWRRRAERDPVLIAIDEAHNVLPAATDDPLRQAAATSGC